MALRRVRIYNGPAEGSMMVGFSAGATDAPDNPAFAYFMAERGYAWQESARRPFNSVSCRHIEVRPPMSDQHVAELGALCVDGMTVNDASVWPIVDGYHDGVAVTDHRAEPSFMPLGDGALVAWR